MNKTNAMRILDRAKLKYEVAEYEYDENDLNGKHIAEGMGVPYSQVFKTLVTRGNGGFYVFCIPVDKELDLKKCARAAGVKSVEMIAVKEMLSVTGYIRGGCSPVGMKKQYPTFFDKSALEQEKIAVSAGVRGGQIIMSPKSLIDFTKSKIEELTQ